MASATDGHFRHSSYKGAFMYEEGGRGGRRCRCVAACRREGPHLFMAVVVMVEELCTFVIIGPRPISWGLLPRSVEVTATVCKSCTPQKGKILITSWQSFPLITQPGPVPLFLCSTWRAVNNKVLGSRDTMSWNQTAGSSARISTHLSWFTS